MPAPDALAETGCTLLTRIVIALGLCASLGAHAQAQPAARPAAAPTVPTPAPRAPDSNCSVSEFRALTLDTHDARQREERARRWLDQNLRACNLAQLRALGSNRGAWLGVADTATIAGQIDGAIERRIRDNPDEVKALFAPAPAPAATVQSTSSGTTPAAPRTRMVGPGTPAITGGTTVTPVPVPVAVPVPAAASPPAEGNPPTRPAAPKPDPSRFSDQQKQSVREHYEQSVVAGDCPPPLQARDGLCETANPIRLWRVGQTLPVTAVIQDLPAALLKLLGTPPEGIRAVRLGTDILLIDARRTVLDAMPDLGSPRAASARDPSNRR
ncbi:MAG: hypothetical protein RL322_358 [Pseudomonadota bacterium]|jgi:hypothetical protein